MRRYADELRIGKGISFLVRMGLNSGEVVVGKIGDDLRMDYTALGHTANLAARMEQIAEPGRIYLAEATVKLIEGFFVLRDLGGHEVKGIARPVGVFELEGVGTLHTRLEVAERRGFSRFVSITLIERTGATTLEPFVCVEQAKLARLRGDETRRTRELRSAHRLFLHIGAPLRAAMVATELGL